MTTQLYYVSAHMKKDGQRLDLLVEATCSEVAVGLWCDHYDMPHDCGKYVALDTYKVPALVGENRPLTPRSGLDITPN